LLRIDFMRAADRYHSRARLKSADVFEDARDYGALGDEGVRSLRDCARSAGCAFTSPLRGSLRLLHVFAAASAV